MDQKKRKNNFTDSEIRKLIEMYSQHKMTLTAKHSNTITNKKKQSSWKIITDAINMLTDSGGQRAVEDVRKKWKDLVSKARKDVSARKSHPTGGGPPPKISIYSDIIVDVFGEDSPTFTGLLGVDSSDCQQPAEGDVYATSTPSDDTFIESVIDHEGAQIPHYTISNVMLCLATLHDL